MLIPTYNNDATLKSVIDRVLDYTTQVIIVNDGATDTTSQILESYTDLQQIHIENNRGKGNALRVGFDHAENLGYHFAISIDSDGQHFPEDIPVFVNALEQDEDKNVLFIGSRNMNQDGIPKKSSFGNTFSNFWFNVETGIKLEDTQSGFRLYPLKEIKKLTLYTTKFELEIEVIVKAAWSGVRVKNIPIQILYQEEERVSHFRPFKDFTRISILNTWLVIVTFLFIKPRDFFRKFKKKSIKRFFFEDFLGSQDPPKKKALSVALGVFVGVSPFWGFHTLIVITLAIFFKLNKTLSFTFSNVSLPPFIPFIVYCSLKIGQFFFGTDLNYTMEDMFGKLEVFKHLKIYIVGSLSLGVISAVTLGFLSYFLFLVFGKNYAK
ncbi:DUF2062 domain-containing protein [Dokdonia sp.]|uniref:DUF2062 domain-containing protein n=1 Tax=Dokdonia sp. TaxID=2024995 RepID=UPI003266AE20